MSINFTGIKNTGSLIITYPVENKEDIAFSTMLTDDSRGKDYTEYSSILTKADIPLNVYNSNMLSIGLTRKYPENKNGDIDYTFFVNGMLLEKNDKNIPVFSYIARITKNISEMKDSEIILNDDFIKSDSFRFGMIPNVDMKELFENFTSDYISAAETLYEKDSARLGAKKVNNSIVGAMMQYFA